MKLFRAPRTIVIASTKQPCSSTQLQPLFTCVFQHIESSIQRERRPCVTQISRRFFIAPSPPRQKTQSYKTPAHDLNQDITKEEESAYDRAVAEDRGKQVKTPWQRAESDKPPAERPRSAGAMVKGKLLTTPTRLFKLVLPLTTRDFNTDRKDAEPLALLLHPSQPLSYLERLIQAELPPTKDGDKEVIPAVNFWAQDSSRDDLELNESDTVADRTEREAAAYDETETTTAIELRGGPGEGGVETYSGLGHEREKRDVDEKFVKWSKSTEIGDFMRDAARGREFAVDIESAPYWIRVGVPSFGDRTYYLRLRLRKKAQQISRMAETKKECDLEAHRSAQRVAYAGFAGLAGWGVVVAWLTFMTDLGWDVMEPITYLIGMLGLLIGYGWFLMHNREASYRAAMNLTVSRRQQQLYERAGFDFQKWQYLVEEANALRREIMSIAAEYNVEWDEKEDEQDDKVIEALKEHRNERKGKNKKGSKEDDEDDEEE